MKIGYIAGLVGAATRMDGNVKVGMNLSTLPNALTVGRGLAAPVVVWLLVHGFQHAAFWLFLAAAISDVVDGYLAKYLNCASAFGAWVDPVADKLLVAGTFLALGWIAVIPGWLVALVVARDLGILAGVGLLQATRRPFHMRPTLISKFNTFAQLLLVGFALGQLGLDLQESGFITAVVRALVAVTAVMTAASWLVYARDFARAMAHAPR